MARVYFNIRFDGALVPDTVGQEGADPEAVRAAARTIVRRLVRRYGGEPRLLDAALVVTDAAGAPVLEMSFFEALYLPVEPAVRPGQVLRRSALLSEERLGAALRPVRRLADAVSARVQPLLGP